jgi:ribosome-associated GTPase EngA
MEVIISNYPEELTFPQEYIDNVKAAAEMVGKLYDVENGEVSITLTNNAYIHTLNKQYRGIDRPTDVLSFALNESEEPEIEGEPEVDVLGDLIISVERAEEQAADYGHSVRREMAFLTVHGMLHLLGYDHMEDADREEMEEEQRYVMGQLGISREDKAEKEPEKAAVKQPAAKKGKHKSGFIAVIGRPNVGKSSIVNQLLGEERVIVSDMAGTTRDAIDTHFVKDGMKFMLIDTAGMRRRGKIDEPVERYSVMRSLRAIDRADVVLMMIDASEGITEQDKKIAGYAHESGRGVVIVVNKWDIYPNKDDKSTLRFTEELREDIGCLQYAPVLYASALTGQRVGRVTELVKYVAEQQSMRIKTSVLNELIRDAVSINPPPMHRGRRLKILFMTQADVKPPKFIIFVNDPELMHFSYLRFIENRLREMYGFEGTPLRLIVRARDEEDEY